MEKKGGKTPDKKKPCQTCSLQRKYPGSAFGPLVSMAESVIPEMLPPGIPPLPALVQNTALAQFEDKVGRMIESSMFGSLVSKRLSKVDDGPYAIHTTIPKSITDRLKKKKSARSSPKKGLEKIVTNVPKPDATKEMSSVLTSDTVNPVTSRPKTQLLAALPTDTTTKLEEASQHTTVPTMSDVSSQYNQATPSGITPESKLPEIVANISQIVTSVHHVMVSRESPLTSQSFQPGSEDIKTSTSVVERSSVSIALQDQHMKSGTPQDHQTGAPKFISLSTVLTSLRNKTETTKLVAEPIPTPIIEAISEASENSAPTDTKLMEALVTPVRKPRKLKVNPRPGIGSMMGIPPKLAKPVELKESSSLVYLERPQPAFFPVVRRPLITDDLEYDGAEALEMLYKIIINRRLRKVSKDGSEITISDSVGESMASVEKPMSDRKVKPSTAIGAMMGLPKKSKKLPVQSTSSAESGLRTKTPSVFQDFQTRGKPIEKVEDTDSMGSQRSWATFEFQNEEDIPSMMHSRNPSMTHTQHMSVSFRTDSLQSDKTRPILKAPKPQYEDPMLFLPSAPTLSSSDQSDSYGHYQTPSFVAEVAVRPQTGANVNPRPGMGAMMGVPPKLRRPSDASEFPTNPNTPSVFNEVPVQQKPANMNPGPGIGAMMGTRPLLRRPDSVTELDYGHKTPSILREIHTEGNPVGARPNPRPGVGSMMGTMPHLRKPCTITDSTQAQQTPSFFDEIPTEGQPIGPRNNPRPGIAAMMGTNPLLRHPDTSDTEQYTQATPSMFSEIPTEGQPIGPRVNPRPGMGSMMGTAPFLRNANAVTESNANTNATPSIFSEIPTEGQPIEPRPNPRPGMGSMMGTQPFLRRPADASGTSDEVFETPTIFSGVDIEGAPIEEHRSSSEYVSVAEMLSQQAEFYLNSQQSSPLDNHKANAKASEVSTGKTFTPLSSFSQTVSDAIQHHVRTRQNPRPGIGSMMGVPPKLKKEHSGIEDNTPNTATPSMLRDVHLEVPTGTHLAKPNARPGIGAMMGIPPKLKGSDNSDLEATKTVTPSVFKELPQHRVYPNSRPGIGAMMGVPPRLKHSPTESNAESNSKTPTLLQDVHLQGKNATKGTQHHKGLTSMMGIPSKDQNKVKDSETSSSHAVPEFVDEVPLQSGYTEKIVPSQRLAVGSMMGTAPKQKPPVSEFESTKTPSYVQDVHVEGKNLVGRTLNSRPAIGEMVGVPPQLKRPAYVSESTAKTPSFVKEVVLKPVDKADKHNPRPGIGAMMGVPPSLKRPSFASGTETSAGMTPTVVQEIEHAAYMKTRKSSSKLGIQSMMGSMTHQVTPAATSTLTTTKTHTPIFKDAVAPMSNIKIVAYSDSEPTISAKEQMLHGKPMIGGEETPLMLGQLSNSNMNVSTMGSTKETTGSGTHLEKPTSTVSIYDPQTDSLVEIPAQSQEYINHVPDAKTILKSHPKLVTPAEVHQYRTNHSAHTKKSKRYSKVAIGSMMGVPPRLAKPRSVSPETEKSQPPSFVLDVKLGQGMMSEDEDADLNVALEKTSKVTYNADSTTVGNASPDNPPSFFPQVTKEPEHYFPEEIVELVPEMVRRKTSILSTTVGNLDPTHPPSFFPEVQKSDHTEPPTPSTYSQTNDEASGALNNIHIFNGAYLDMEVEALGTAPDEDNNALYSEAAYNNSDQDSGAIFMSYSNTLAEPDEEASSLGIAHSITADPIREEESVDVKPGVVGAIMGFSPGISHPKPDSDEVDTTKGSQPPSFFPNGEIKVLQCVQIPEPDQKSLKGHMSHSEHVDISNFAAWKDTESHQMINDPHGQPVQSSNHQMQMIYNTADPGKPSSESVHSAASLGPPPMPLDGFKDKTEYQNDNQKKQDCVCRDVPSNQKHDSDASDQLTVSAPARLQKDKLESEFRMKKSKNPTSGTTDATTRCVRTSDTILGSTSKPEVKHGIEKPSDSTHHTDEHNVHETTVPETTTIPTPTDMKESSSTSNVIPEKPEVGQNGTPREQTMIGTKSATESITILPGNMIPDVFKTGSQEFDPKEMVNSLNGAEEIEEPSNGLKTDSNYEDHVEPFDTIRSNDKDTPVESGFSPTKLSHSEDIRTHTDPTFKLGLNEGISIAVLTDPMATNAEAFAAQLPGVAAARLPPISEGKEESRSSQARHSEVLDPHHILQGIISNSNFVSTPQNPESSPLVSSMAGSSPSHPSDATKDKKSDGENVLEEKQEPALKSEKGSSPNESPKIEVTQEGAHMPGSAPDGANVDKEHQEEIGQISKPSSEERKRFSSGVPSTSSQPYLQNSPHDTNAFFTPKDSMNGPQENIPSIMKSPASRKTSQFVSLNTSDNLGPMRTQTGPTGTFATKADQADDGNTSSTTMEQISPLEYTAERPEAKGDQQHDDETTATSTVMDSIKQLAATAYDTVIHSLPVRRLSLPTCTTKSKSDVCGHPGKRPSTGHVNPPKPKEEPNGNGPEKAFQDKPNESEQPKIDNNPPSKLPESESFVPQSEQASQMRDQNKINKLKALLRKKHGNESSVSSKRNSQLTTDIHSRPGQIAYSSQGSSEGIASQGPDSENTVSSMPTSQNVDEDEGKRNNPLVEAAPKLDVDSAKFSGPLPVNLAKGSVNTILAPQSDGSPNSVSAKPVMRAVNFETSPQTQGTKLAEDSSNKEFNNHAASTPAVPGETNLDGQDRATKSAPAPIGLSLSSDQLLKTSDSTEDKPASPSNNKPQLSSPTVGALTGLKVFGSEHLGPFLKEAEVPSPDSSSQYSHLGEDFSPMHDQEKKSLDHPSAPEYHQSQMNRTSYDRLHDASNSASQLPSHESAAEKSYLAPKPQQAEPENEPGKEGDKQKFDSVSDSPQHSGVTASGSQPPISEMHKSSVVKFDESVDENQLLHHSWSDTDPKSAPVDKVKAEGICEERTLHPIGIKKRSEGSSKSALKAQESQEHGPQEDLRNENQSTEPNQDMKDQNVEPGRENHSEGADDWQKFSTQDTFGCHTKRNKLPGNAGTGNQLKPSEETMHSDSPDRTSKGALPLSSAKSYPSSDQSTQQEVSKENISTAPELKQNASISAHKSEDMDCCGKASSINYHASSNSLLANLTKAESDRAFNEVCICDEAAQEMVFDSKNFYSSHSSSSAPKAGKPDSYLSVPSPQKSGDKHMMVKNADSEHEMTYVVKSYSSILRPMSSERLVSSAGEDDDEDGDHTPAVPRLSAMFKDHPKFKPAFDAVERAAKRKRAKQAGNLVQPKDRSPASSTEALSSHTEHFGENAIHIIPRLSAWELRDHSGPTDYGYIVEKLDTDSSDDSGIGFSSRASPEKHKHLKWLTQPYNQKAGKARLKALKKSSPGKMFDPMESLSDVKTDHSHHYRILPEGIEEGVGNAVGDEDQKTGNEDYSSSSSFAVE